MGRKSTKDNKTIYQQVREELQLSREQASSLLEYISEDRIEKIESGKTLIRPDEAMRMAEVYKKPELTNYYCSHECPIGQKYIPEVNEKQLSQITVEVLGSLNSLSKLKDRLVEISYDGKISKDELEDFRKIESGLKDLKATIDSLSLWVEKQKIDD